MKSSALAAIVASLTFSEIVKAAWLDGGRLREQDIVNRRRAVLRPRSSASVIISRVAVPRDAPYLQCQPTADGQYDFFGSFVETTADGKSYIECSYNSIVCRYDLTTGMLLPSYPTNCPEQAVIPDDAIESNCFSSCAASRGNAVSSIQIDPNVGITTCSFGSSDDVCYYDSTIGTLIPEINDDDETYTSAPACSEGGRKVERAVCLPSGQGEKSLSVAIDPQYGKYFTCPEIPGKTIYESRVAYRMYAVETRLQCYYDFGIYSYDTSTGARTEGDNMGPAQLSEPAAGYTKQCYTLCSLRGDDTFDRAYVLTIPALSVCRVYNDAIGDDVPCMFNAETGDYVPSYTQDGQVYESDSICITDRVKVSKSVCVA